MANTASGEQGIFSAGDVNVEVSISSALGGQEFDIRQFVGEINIFEDIFKNSLYGNILLIDAANLASIIPIVGDEYITLRISTPSIDQKIYRAFKVYSMTDRTIIRDTNTQSYILHFCSPEMYIDLMTPLYATYRGNVTDVVQQIWNESVAVTRTGQSDVSKLIMIGETDNELHFTSPGWSALKCLNWLAARAIPRGLKAPNFLLYESNKNFYFASLEAIISQGKGDREYIYTPNNLTAPSGDRYVKDIDAEYKKVEEFKVVETFNGFKNNLNGYYANRLVTFDISNKQFEYFDYDHVASFGEYKHLDNAPPFKSDTLREPGSYITFYPKHHQLYTFAFRNVNDRIEEILPRRYSTIHEFSNFKLEITVPGRCDIEVGAIVKFRFPDVRPRDGADKNQSGEDKYYSGYYLVTAIRHKITLQRHMMILELAKDSFHSGA